MNIKCPQLDIYRWSSQVVN